MNLTDDSKTFNLAVFSVVSQIPYGKVTSYGHIAYLINRPANSRHVGFSLKHQELILDALNKDNPENPIDRNSLPWWRVLSSVGKISPRNDSHSELTQANLLRSEGVVVSSNHRVDLNEFGWFPDEVEF